MLERVGHKGLEGRWRKEGCLVVTVDFDHRATGRCLIKTFGCKLTEACPSLTLVMQISIYRHLPAGSCLQLTAS